MENEEISQEERILRVVRKVLTDVAKDTYTKPGFKHPLSDQTIAGIRECLSLIAAREQELAEAAGRPSRERPRYIDEPRKSVVVPLDKSGLIKKRGEEEGD